MYINILKIEDVYVVKSSNNSENYKNKCKYFLLPKSHFPVPLPLGNHCKPFLLNSS